MINKLRNFATYCQLSVCLSVTYDRTLVGIIFITRMTYVLTDVLWGVAHKISRNLFSHFKYVFSL